MSDWRNLTSQQLADWVPPSVATRPIQSSTLEWQNLTPQQLADWVPPPIATRPIQSAALSRRKSPEKKAAVFVPDSPPAPDDDGFDPTKYVDRYLRPTYLIEQAETNLLVSQNELKEARDPKDIQKATAEVYFWQVLLLWKRRERIKQQIKELSQSMEETVKVGASSDERSKELRNLAKELDVVRTELVAAIQNSKDLDQELGEEYREREHKQRDPTPEEKEVGFKPAWFADPMQLRWSWTACLIYLHHCRAIYDANSSNEDQYRQSVASYSRVLLAGALTLHALIAKPTDKLREELKQVCKRVRTWLKQVPADLDIESVPSAPSEFDTRWVKREDLHKDAFPRIHKERVAIAGKIGSVGPKSPKTEEDERELARLHLEFLRLRAIEKRINYDLARQTGTAIESTLRDSRKANLDFANELINARNAAPGDLSGVVERIVLGTPEPRRRQQRAQPDAPVDKKQQEVRNEAIVIRSKLWEVRARLQRQIRDGEDAEQITISKATIAARLREIRTLLEQNATQPWVKEFPEFLPPGADPVDLKSVAPPLSKPWQMPEQAKKYDFKPQDWARTLKQDEEVKQDLLQLQKEHQENKATAKSRRIWELEALAYIAELAKLEVLMNTKNDKIAYEAAQQAPPPINPDIPTPEQLSYSVAKIRVELRKSDERLARLRRRVAEGESGNLLAYDVRNTEDLEREQQLHLQLEYLLQTRASADDDYFKRKPADNEPLDLTTSDTEEPEPDEEVQIIRDSFGFPRPAGSALGIKKEEEPSSKDEKQEEEEPVIRKRTRSKRVISEDEQEEKETQEVEEKADEQEPQQEPEQQPLDDENGDETAAFFESQKSFASLAAAFYARENATDAKERFFITGTDAFASIERFAEWLGNALVQQEVAESAEAGFKIGLAEDQKHLQLFPLDLSRKLPDETNNIPEYFRKSVISFAVKETRRLEDENQAFRFFTPDGKFIEDKADKFQVIPWLQFCFDDLADKGVKFVATPEGIEEAEDEETYALGLKEQRREESRNLAGVSLDIDTTKIAKVWELDLQLCRAALYFADGEILDSHRHVNKHMKALVPARQKFTQRWALMLWSSRAISSPHLAQILRKTNNGNYTALADVFDTDNKALGAATRDDLKVFASIEDDDDLPTIDEGKLSGWFRHIIAINLAVAHAIHENKAPGEFFGKLMMHMFGSDKLVKKAAKNHGNLEWWLKNVLAVYRPGSLDIKQMGLPVALLLALLHPDFVRVCGLGETTKQQFREFVTFLAPLVFWALRIACQNKVATQGPLNLSNNPWLLGGWIALHYYRQLLLDKTYGIAEKWDLFNEFRKTYNKIRKATKKKKEPEEGKTNITTSIINFGNADDSKVRKATKKKKEPEEGKTNITTSIINFGNADDSKVDITMLAELLDERLPQLLSKMTHTPDKTNTRQNKELELRSVEINQEAALDQIRAAIEEAKDLNLADVPDDDKDGRKEWSLQHRLALVLAPDLAGQVLSMTKSQRRIDAATLKFAKLGVGLQSIMSSGDRSQWQPIAYAFKEHMIWRALRFRLTYNWLQVVFSFAQGAQRKPAEKKVEKKQEEIKKEQEAKKPPAQGSAWKEQQRALALQRGQKLPGESSSSSGSDDEDMDLEEDASGDEEIRAEGAKEQQEDEEKTASEAEESDLEEQVQDWKAEYPKLTLQQMQKLRQKLDDRIISKKTQDADDFSRRRLLDDLIPKARLQEAIAKAEEGEHDYDNATRFVALPSEQRKELLRGLPRRLFDELKDKLVAQLVEYRNLGVVFSGPDVAGWVVRERYTEKKEGKDAQRVADAYRDFFNLGDVDRPWSSQTVEEMITQAGVYKLKPKSLQEEILKYIYQIPTITDKAVLQGIIGQNEKGTVGGYKWLMAQLAKQQLYRLKQEEVYGESDD